MGPFSTSTIHPPRICDPGRRVEHARRHGHFGEVSIPALGSLIVSVRVPQTRLAERDVEVFWSGG